MSLVALMLVPSTFRAGRESESTFRILLTELPLAAPSDVVCVGPQVIPNVPVCVDLLYFGTHIHLAIVYAVPFFNVCIHTREVQYVCPQPTESNLHLDTCAILDLRVGPPVVTTGRPF